MYCLPKIGKKLKKEVKLLLLGPGESGKSTIFKQMKIISLYGGFSADELENWRVIVYFNIITEMKILLENASKLGFELESDEAKSAAHSLEQISADGDTWSPEIGKMISLLWKDGAVQKTYTLRDKEYQLNESAHYFFDDIARFSQKDYAPSHQDILRARVRSVGIEESQFNLDGLELKMIDVGGQRSERRKWIHCFEGVTAVLFCASLSEYDQYLREDKKQNRMTESLLLFDEISNSPWFEKTAIILFLNKTDLLKDKIAKVDNLKKIFNDYNGGCNYQNAADFIKKKYNELVDTKKKKQLYVHFTCAIDTEGILFVFKAVKDTILRDIIDTQIF